MQRVSLKLDKTWGQCQRAKDHSARSKAIAMKKADETKLAKAYQDGLAAEKAGDLEGAKASYEICLALDPDDWGGVAVRLAGLGLADAPEVAPEAYVTTLFDQHAENFDAILVGQLGYRVPELIAEKLAALELTHFDTMLDLGCGTGLAGAAMRDACDMIIGIDLSENMITLSDERNVYDDLYIGEAVAYLEEGEDGPFDLIIAADVLPYLGDLNAFFAGLVLKSQQGSVIAFSSETLPDTEFLAAGYKVGPHQRFHHARSYVEKQLSQYGFVALTFDDIIVRTDLGEPQNGHLVIARKI